MDTAWTLHFNNLNRRNSRQITEPPAAPQADFLQREQQRAPELSWETGGGCTGFTQSRDVVGDGLTGLSSQLQLLVGHPLQAWG